ncbi:cupin domain-containing protein [Methylocystis heyeri]|uniref:Cupin domain-containing protein n=1 Tax=Methylocystis heyeri TaxID=391905 RepID=A0A6B8KDZ7_9HYPH|nr:cupin domain-containing protein [Methylocystis heyeri]QGM45231.1 cupin domain-containing protein [Methylocystis heyeri]
MSQFNFSHAGEIAAVKIEADIKKRLFLGAMAGAACIFSGAPLRAQIKAAVNTTVSQHGIIRTTLQNHINADGEEFRMVLTTYPPGVGLPVHHHPSVAHNYILEGVAESQYAGEELQRFTAGESYQDKADSRHIIFRNPEATSTLKYLIVYTVKKGQPFLIVP